MQIGDHVWLGTDVTVLKGANIGGNIIAGAKSLLTNKEYFENSIYAGNPAKR